MKIAPVSMTNQYRTNHSNLRKENVSSVMLNFKANSKSVSKRSDVANKTIIEMVNDKYDPIIIAADRYIRQALKEESMKNQAKAEQEAFIAELNKKYGNSSAE